MNLFWWLVLAGLLGLFIYIKIKFKVPKFGSLVLVSGGVKTGKSTFSVALVLKSFKRRVRRIKFINFFRKLFKKELIELPLIYSNIPLNLPYVELTEDLLLRKKRFVYGSVIYCCEASLVADSQLIKDMDINERLLLFNKLIGHETKGGCLIYDTQCISDCHYSIKRCLSNYFYIHHLTKWIPGFLVAEIRELKYSDDNTSINSFNEDIEENLKKVLIPKSVWKKFDCYCYSCLTDNLEVEKEVILPTSLKAEKIVSFRNSRSIGQHLEDTLKNKGVGGYKNYAKINYKKFK